jgi:hypothetical protein
MEQIIRDLTLEQISLIIVFILGLYAGVKQLRKEIKEAISESLKDQFDQINGKLSDMQHKMDKIDEQACKNFLVRYLADIERGVPIYDDEKSRFWEEYDHYINPNEINGNSYIKEWVARLKEEGKLRR